jgi:hypothetical protein
MGDKLDCVLEGSEDYNDLVIRLSILFQNIN